MVLLTYRRLELSHTIFFFFYLPSHGKRFSRSGYSAAPRALRGISLPLPNYRIDSTQLEGFLVLARMYRVEDCTIRIACMISYLEKIVCTYVHSIDNESVQ
jgi:hypothetical protein